MNFVDFAKMLTEGEKLDSLYTSDFVKCIIDQFWSTARRAILLKRLLPFAAMACWQIWYMYEVLRWSDI